MDGLIFLPGSNSRLATVQAICILDIQVVNLIHDFLTVHDYSCIYVLACTEILLSLTIRVQLFLKMKKSPASVVRKSSVLILKNIFNFVCVVLASKL